MTEKITRPAAAFGCTNFPKVPLSFKWSISNAKTLLQIMSSRRELKGPPFDVHLPSESGELKTSTWYLSISTANGNATSRQHGQNLVVNDNFFSVYLRCSDCSTADQFRELQPVPRQSSHLYHAAPVPKRHKQTCSTSYSKYWITDCTFSVLDASNGGIKSVFVPPVECAQGGSTQCGVRDFIPNDRLNEFLHNDSLTLLVVASLTYFMDPIQVTLATSNPVPSKDVLKSLLKNKLYADIVIKCGEKKFKAHKAVLASQSPVFNRMFECDMQEKKNNTIEIEDINPDVISDMLSFLYTGCAPNLTLLADGLLNAATKYELPRLVVMCENELMLKISVDTVLVMLQCADMYQAQNLKKACLSVIRCNSTEIYKTEAWKDFKTNSHKELVYEVLECKE